MPCTPSQVEKFRAFVSGGKQYLSDIRAMAGGGKFDDAYRKAGELDAQSCSRCHGADLQRSQLRLDSRTAALRGGLSGPVIVPGRSGESPLVQRHGRFIGSSFASRSTPRFGLR